MCSATTRTTDLDALTDHQRGHGADRRDRDEQRHRRDLHAARRLPRHRHVRLHHRRRERWAGHGDGHGHGRVRERCPGREPTRRSSRVEDTAHTFVAVRLRLHGSERHAGRQPGGHRRHDAPRRRRADRQREPRRRGRRDRSVPTSPAASSSSRPATNASGSGYASFTFQVRDDGGTANGGDDLDPSADTITINVTADNDDPDAVDDTLTVARNAAADRGRRPRQRHGRRERHPARSPGRPTVPRARSRSPAAAPASPTIRPPGRRGRTPSPTRSATATAASTPGPSTSRSATPRPTP